jgi:hypothetical protein
MSRGLKPTSVAGLIVRAKARTYLRDKSKISERIDKKDFEVYSEQLCESAGARVHEEPLADEVAHLLLLGLEVFLEGGFGGDFGRDALGDGDADGF